MNDPKKDPPKGIKRVIIDLCKIFLYMVVIAMVFLAIVSGSDSDSDSDVTDIKCGTLKTIMHDDHLYVVYDSYYGGHFIHSPDCQCEPSTSGLE